MIWLPTAQQVIKLHSKMIDKSGGSDGVRDFGLIESAIMRASAGFGGCEVYPTAIQKAAAVCCGLIGNHGFVDGNKRIGVAVMLLILIKNGISINYTQQELIQFGLDTAQGLIDVEGCVRWIQEHQTN